MKVPDLGGTAGDPSSATSWHPPAFRQPISGAFTLPSERTPATRANADAFDRSFPRHYRRNPPTVRKCPISPRREFAHVTLRYYLF